MSKQNSPVTMRRENDRYWILAAHRSANLLAAGHDSGLVVFKLDKERPAFDHGETALYYHKDQYVYEYNTKTQKEKPILSTRRRGGGTSAPVTLAYNASNKTQHNVLLTYDTDGSYELYNVNMGGTNSSDDGAAALRGYGKCAIFVSRNRFAVLDKSRQIWLKNLENETKRQITVPNVVVTAMFPGGIGRLLLRSADAMILFDIQALKVLAELPLQSRHVIKQVAWSKDNKHVAVWSKNGIHITTAKLEELCCVTENGKVKSGAWDACGVFIYTTSTHLKYLLPNGDGGTIRTLDETVYLVSVSQGTASYMTRETVIDSRAFDDTEYLFKLALHSKKNRDVFRIMQSKKLVGRSITAYLHDKGFPEVALHFVQDAEAKFPLALECGNIGAALECATQLDNDECWHKLGVEALRQGNHQVVEAAYQKTKNFERLSFLYLITGNLDKLRKMLHIATLTEDLMGRFHNALYLGDVAERVAVLKDAGRTKLAYITAKAHGLEEQAAALAEVLGEDNIPPLPKRLGRGKLLAPATPLLREANWPILATRKTFFDLLEQEDGEAGPSEETQQEVQALLAEEAQTENDAMDDALGDWGGDDDGEGGLGLMGEEAGAADTSMGGGWDDDMGLGLGITSGGGDDDVEEAAGDDGDMFVMPMPGRSAAALWQEHSTLACHLVAAGAFDQAMHVLNRTIGVVNFAPLKPSFFAIHRAAYATLPQLPGGADLVSPLQRATGNDDAMLPAVCVTLPQCVELLKKAYASVTGGKFTDALAASTAILHALPLLCAESKAQEMEAIELGQICREYVTAMRLELAKRDTTDPARKASLAVHFTLCKLQPMHNILALRVAIKTCFAIKCYKTTGSLCRRVLDLGVSSNKEALQKVVKFQEIRDVLKRCEQEATEAHELDVDESAKFTLCASTLTRIAKGEQTVACPFCKSQYALEFAGSLCATCSLSKVGAECSGLKIFS
jgi:coatomer protein complex subunit alpha (xenin)